MIPYKLELGALEDKREFLEMALLTGIRGGHGTLIAVLKSDDGASDGYHGGVWLRGQDRVPLGKLVADATDVLGISRRLGWEHLLHGALSSDGITLLNTRGELVGFNAMIDFTAQDVVGGARSRAFEALRARVGTSLVAALKVSQDGGIVYAGEDNDK